MTNSKMKIQDHNGERT
jgi:hypothetical protein